MEDFKPSVILEMGVQCFMLSDYTQYENTLLMRILRCCQEDIHNAITQQRVNNELQFTREECSELVRHRKIAIRLLEPQKGHYGRARIALTDMSKKRILLIAKTQSGKLTYVSFPNLFTVSFSTENQRGYVTLHARIQVLRYFLSTSMGYHRINLDTYFSFRHFSTRQLYRLYYAHFSHGYYKLDPTWIASAFSFGGKYKSYSNIANNLLSVAEKEMKQAYDKGLCDFYFHYKPDYGVKEESQGMCEKVTFTFICRQDDHPEGERLSQLTGFQCRIKTVLDYLWGVDSKVSEGLCARIRLDMIPDLEDFFKRKQWFASMMKERGTPLRNKAGYIVKKVNEFLQERGA